MNSFGQLFRITTFGESHGPALGVIIDGCPPGLRLNGDDFSRDLARRKTGQSSIVSARKEEDKVEILSGVFEGRTTGTALALMIRNTDAKSEHYEMLKKSYRPSHADFTYDEKFGFRDYRGGGRASARETVARVLAGVVAKKLLAEECGMEFQAYVKQVGEIEAMIDPMKVKMKDVETSMVRCPDTKTSAMMIDLIKKVQKKGDTVGGVVECVVKNVPSGLGDPVFDKLKATLAHAMMSLPATMGFEIGSGFGSMGMRGSEHNDIFIASGKKVSTKTNNSGGVQGGISNGMPIVFRTAFKPVSTIFQKQQTVTRDLKKIDLQMIGRHDPCVVPRAVVIVEAMAAVVMADHYLRQKAVVS